MRCNCHYIAVDPCAEDNHPCDGMMIGADSTIPFYNDTTSMAQPEVPLCDKF